MGFCDHFGGVYNASPHYPMPQYGVSARAYATPKLLPELSDSLARNSTTLLRASKDR